jgi:hypothetical protein
MNVINDKKCAPGRKYENGSCFSHEALKKIANAYNNKFFDKIDINLDKPELINELSNRLSNICSEQTCWLKQQFVMSIDDDILNNTFRPKGPTGKYEWLSTSDIDNVIEQYHKIHPEFQYLGTVPIDFENLAILGLRNINFGEYENNNKHKLGLVINLDEHYKSGSHWVALYIDLKDYKIYYFDSVGKKPKTRTKKFINKIIKYLYKKEYNNKLPLNKLIKQYNIGDTENKYIKNLSKFDIRYNNIQHQFENSECGVYSINFIIRLVNKESFDDIINNITSDEEMNKYRKEIFINVN